MKISGYTVVRNGLSLDYCFELAIKSLLPVCDEVLVCDSDSDDGTREKLDAMAKENKKICVENRPWMKPHADLRFVIDWMNDARKLLAHPMQLYLDADEVLDPLCYDTVRELSGDMRSAWFTRLNFYGGADRVAESVCGVNVARLGPAAFFMPADEPERDEPLIRRVAVKHPALRIFHYGFLRKPDAFYRKSKVVMNGFFGSEDPRVVKCEADGVRDWAAAIPVPTTKFDGEHPEIARDWLKERGWL